MRKVTDSAAGAVTIDPVNPKLAIDLGGDNFVQGMKRRRKLAAFQADVELETERLTARARWCVKTARRLPINSNGRKKRKLEAVLCGMLCRHLADALAGNPFPKLQPGGPRQAHRAIRLLNDMHAATA